MNASHILNLGLIVVSALLFALILAGPALAHAIWCWWRPSPVALFVQLPEAGPRRRAERLVGAGLRRVPHLPCGVRAVSVQQLCLDVFDGHQLNGYAQRLTLPPPVTSKAKARVKARQWWHLHLARERSGHELPEAEQLAALNELCRLVAASDTRDFIPLAFSAPPMPSALPATPAGVPAATPQP